jgi:N-glycosylase/DNA lyase
MKRTIEKSTVRKLRDAHRAKSSEIAGRLKQFSAVRPEEYFYEAVYCLLTPQSSAVNAGKAVELLRAHDLRNSPIDPAPLLHQKEFYIRFHRTKAKHLLAIKDQYAELHPRLLNGSTSLELRDWLVKNVRGLGWKEASHFLRNIGHRDLAILDRHILRNLVRFGALRTLPKTLTAKRYLAIEEKFRRFAAKVEIPMDELDLLFWWMGTGQILK